MLKNEMFFDSLDRLSASEEESTSSRYEIWANEPRSVQERRESFLRKMGFLGEISSLEKVIGSNPIVEQSLVQDHDEEEEEEEEDFEESKCLPIESPIKEDEDEEDEVEEEEKNIENGAKKALMRNWWKRFVRARKEKRNQPISGLNSGDKRVKVCRNSKRFLELTGASLGQEIRAHEGLVWAMKFSPNGRYLASGGEDGVVRVWSVLTVDSDHFTHEGNLCNKSEEQKFGFRRKNSICPSIVLPEKVFTIDESPIKEFYGHSGDVLDLAWSNSNSLISSSMDKTVRLWELDRDESVDVFRHNDYVTCIEFNPVDENYFISGSIDGKVRIWGLNEKRVVDWTDIRDVITAICYQPDGKGFIVGTITGTCRRYKSSGECILLETNINISGRKKTSGNKITGIKFSHDKPQRVMISSEDSKLRIFDGSDLTHKYKGLAKSGSQTSASFTGNETHIVSVGEDSRVYVWNYDSSSSGISSKQTKSVRSCEHFMSERASLAVPWPGMSDSSSDNVVMSLNSQPLELTLWSKDSERFSLGSWFSGTATWPEEKLPLWADLAEESQSQSQSQNRHVLSSTWGLVIVTAGLDGVIRTFHNYGLPLRL